LLQTNSNTTNNVWLFFWPLNNRFALFWPLLSTVRLFIEIFIWQPSWIVTVSAVSGVASPKIWGEPKCLILGE